jgi:ubiquinol-cytochrome c reductase cytochrome b subunit
VLTKGINEYPTPGKLVKKETYDKEYEELIHKEGIPFFPNGISKDFVASAVVILGILACAFFLGPKGPEAPPTPAIIDAMPRPDFPFMWIFGVASLLPDYLETPVLLGGPVIISILLLVLPFVSNTGEKSWRRRPAAVLTVIFVWMSLAVLTYLGITSPWSPQMEAWTSDKIPAKFIEGRTPLEIQGAAVLQYMQCRNCHAIDGVGGTRGPDLAAVGTRLTRDQLIRQVIQGGGNMPAYGKNLSPAEVEALVSYMVTLRPHNELPARDSSVPAVPPAQASENPKAE